MGTFSRIKIKSAVWVGLFLLLFGIGWPQPAHADVMDAIILAATKVLDEIEYAYADLQRAAGAASNVAAAQGVGETTMRASQAQVDQVARTPYMNAAANVAGAYGMTTNTDFCRQTALASAMYDMANATSALSQSLETTNLKTASTNDPSSAPLSLMDRCKKGFFDVANDKKLQKAGCPVPGGFNGHQYFGADQTASSVVEPDQYSVPTNITVDKNGSMVLPDATKITTEDEMKYVAAVYFCNERRPTISVAPNGQDTSNFTYGDSTSRVNNSKTLGDVSGPYKVCTDAIAYRTAVSQTVSGKTAELKKVYDAEQGTCLQLKEMGILSAAAYSDCQKNGISNLMAEKLMAHPWKEPGYSEWLAKTSQLSTAELRKMQTESVRYGSEFDRDLRKQTRETMEVLMHEFNVPSSGGGDPSDRSIKQ